MKKDMPKRCKETADHHYYQTTEEQDKGVETVMNTKRLHSLFLFNMMV